MIDFKNNNITIGLILLIAIFVWFKWSYLSLPFYWDEAWVYGPAVKEMIKNGIGLLPASLPPELSRGHPLMFHFLAALFGKIAGDSVFYLHLFSLLVAVVFLMVFYKNIKENKIFALFLTGVLAFQPIFLAQSGLLLPEMLLSLFCFLALKNYLNKAYKWYVFYASMALLTKETGVVLIAATGMFFLINHVSLITKNIQSFLKQSVIIVLPLLPYLVFLMIQKQQNGWYFFPEHIDYVQFSFKDVFEKLERYFSYVFLYQGRNVLFFTALVSIVVFWLKHKKLPFNKEHLLWFLFIVSFLIFSSLNFYSDRYMLPVIAPFICLFGSFMAKVFKKIWILPLVLVFAYVLLDRNHQLTNSDHNLGYANAVKCHQELVVYMIEKGMEDEKIYAYFMTREILQNPVIGYVDSNHVFKNITKTFTNDIEYAIFSNFDTDEEDKKLMELPNLELLKTITHRQAWIRLYKYKSN
jgi:hypothetical protein